MTGTYCLFSLKKSHASHHIIFITQAYSTCSKCPPAARTQTRKPWCHVANSTLNNRVTQSGPLAVDASFQFVDLRDLGTIDFFPTNV